MTKDLITCPIENTLKLINRKWIIVLIRDMFIGKKHFLEFKNNHDGLSSTVLSDTLKYMQDNGLISKESKVVNNKNVTEYHLTTKGFKLNRLLYDMAMFGLNEIDCGQRVDSKTLEIYEDYYTHLLK